MNISTAAHFVQLDKRNGENKVQRIEKSNKSYEWKLVRPEERLRRVSECIRLAN